MKSIHLTACGNRAQSLMMVEVSEPNARLRAKLWCASMRRLITATSFYRTQFTKQ